MTESVNFALVREGPSDDGLVPHLRELLVRAGVPEVAGTTRRYTGSVRELLEQVADEEVLPDLVFVHRDTDSREPDNRYEEIRGAAPAIPLDSRLVVPVVPIQETEAWLLLDEMAIRTVVGRPSGTVALVLPALNAIERTASPKEVLEAAVLTASESTGRRYKDAKRKFPAYRRALLERLDIDGPVRSLSAWQRLEADVATAVEVLM